MAHTPEITVCKNGSGYCGRYLCIDLSIQFYLLASGNLKTGFRQRNGGYGCVLSIRYLRIGIDIMVG